MEDKILYVAKLPRAIDGQTHLAVTEEIRAVQGVKITATYGRLLVSGFKALELAQPFQTWILNDRLADLREQVAQAPGRPASLPAHEMRHTDVQSWLENEPAAMARIQAKKDAEEAERIAAEAARAAREEATV